MIEENKESAEKIAELRIKKEKADEKVQNIKSELFNAGYQNNILDLAKAKMEEENKKANDLIIELQEVVHKQQNENKAAKDLIIEYQKLVHKQKYALSTQKTLIFRLVKEKLELKMILSNDVNSNVKTKEVYEGREMIHTSSQTDEKSSELDQNYSLPNNEEIVNLSKEKSEKLKRKVENLQSKFDPIKILQKKPKRSKVDKDKSCKSNDDMTQLPDASEANDQSIESDGNIELKVEIKDLCCLICLKGPFSKKANLKDHLKKIHNDI